MVCLKVDYVTADESRSARIIAVVFVGSFIRTRADRNFNVLTRLNGLALESRITPLYAVLVV